MSGWPKRRELREIGWFLIVLLATSAVFYAAGPLIGSLSGVTQANVPAAALGVVCPTIAAVAVAARTRSLKELMALVTARPRGVLWGVMAVLALPVVVLLSAVLNGQRNDFQVPGVGALSLAVVYAVGSLAEEIGWTAFLLPRLLRITGETMSGLIIGVVWALWHVIPYAQAGHPPWWIVGQCVFTVAFRLFLVRLTVGGGGSVWWAVIGHASYNLAWSLSPGAGSGYDPWATAALTVGIVVLLYAMRFRSLNRSSRRARGTQAPPDTGESTGDR
ncbi:CPBP family intramembrane glutamic endopeptidase [Microbacterium sp. 18062]|uniref:CPBP family intramembrane glutamic endopeptidase n=1 Tax=Microbacterium sp. 18062 TaxID=2681410 RepID=UPI00135C2CA8|nr:CPBP family intramembrane glutamic endopeptidase [Microbacterium sp. 18062]